MAKIAWTVEGSKDGGVAGGGGRGDGNRDVLARRESCVAPPLYQLPSTYTVHLTLLLFIRLAGGGEGAGDDVVREEECGGAGRRGIQDTGKLGSNSV